MPIYTLLVASYTDKVCSILFDTTESVILLISSLTVGHHPSWIAGYPGNHSVAFTGLEQSDGKIIALRYDEDAKGKILATTSSGGQDPCSLLVRKGELLFANYSSGNVGSLPLSPTAPFLSDAQPTMITLTGSGPNKERQESSHPHQVIVHEEYQELFVPDLGADVVCRYKKAANGSWELKGKVEIEKGGGPRHVAFYGGDLFTVLELTSKVVRHRCPPLPHQPTFVTSTTTMSNPPPTPNGMLAAEILIPPTSSSYPTPYMYVSNRNDPSPQGDIIAIFDISKPDTIELIAEVRTGLKHLRGMTFGGKHDRYLVAGGANGGGVKVYERINGGKELVAIASNPYIEAPTGFLWL